MNSAVTVSSERLSSLIDAFREGDSFLQTAHDVGKGFGFVCHHNSYLVARYLKDRGYPVVWTSGAYLTSVPGQMVHHSWIAHSVAGQLSVILELDPHQLRTAGKFPNDPMPGCDSYFPGIKHYGTAIIVNPEIVEVPKDIASMAWLVRSKEVLDRFVADAELVPPGFDFARMDALYRDAKDVSSELFELTEACSTTA